MDSPQPFTYANKKGYIQAVLFGVTPDLMATYKEKINTAINWGLYKPKTDAWCEDIYVDPQARGCGVGEELFQQLLTHCVVNQVRRMIGHFSPSIDNYNPKMTISWYKRLGFNIHDKKGFCFVTKDL